MTEFILNNLYLVLLLPFWLFLIIMVARFFAIYVNNSIISILTLLSSGFGSIICGFAYLRLPADTILDISIPFIKINNFIVDCGLLVDKISLIFAFILFFVSFCVQMYSISYTKIEQKKYRYWALLNLFNFSMAGLIFSPNLFQCYFFWEIVGIISYLLIGFDYNKNEKSLASKKVFLINRIGDTAILSAIIVSSYFIYTYAENVNLTTLPFIDINIISTLIYAYTSTPVFLAITCLFIFGCAVKSAQFPLYTWLQDAMQAKLPISALLHSSTMVISGVFLLLRLIPFFTLEKILLNTILIIGLTTAILCALSACSQTNPKKVLAYSTSAQIGLMLMTIGALNIKATVILFVSHAVIKSLLFLTLPKENDTNWNLCNFIIFITAGLSLSGLIFSGMIAKELIVINSGKFEIALLSVLTALTAFYITRIALLTYIKYEIKTILPLNKIELVSSILLLTSNIVLYFILKRVVEYNITIIFYTALIVWICTYFLFLKNSFFQIPIVYQLSYNGFYLDKIYSTLIVNSYNIIAKICNYIDLKILSNYSIIKYIIKIFIEIAHFIEEKLFNNTIKLISTAFRATSIFDKKIQTGNIQKYNSYAFIIITVILILLILGYKIILNYIGG